MRSHLEKILSGEAPARIILRTERVAAILADRPIKRGHCVVFPAQFVDGWREATPELVAELFSVARRVASAIDREVIAKRVAISIVGVQVAHLHLHLVPVDDPKELDFSRQQDADEAAQTELARRLSAHLAVGG